MDQARGGTKRTSDSNAAPLRGGQAHPSSGVQLELSAYPTSLYTNVDPPNHPVAPSNSRILSKPGKPSKPGTRAGEGQEASRKPCKRAKTGAKPPTAGERQQEEIDTARSAFTNKWAKGKKLMCDWSLLMQYVYVGEGNQEPYAELDAMLSRIREYGTLRLQIAFARSPQL